MTSQPSFSILLEATDRAGLAHQLSEQLQLPVCLPEHAATDWQLALTAGRIELRQNGRGSPGPVWVDFCAGRNAHRLAFGGGKGQPLARAIGLKKCTPAVLDVTAGMGKDAFVLASLGCCVTLLERSQVPAILLADGIERARSDPAVAEIAGRMHLQQVDAIDYLNSPDTAEPEVVYLDPMYPHSGKSAQVKKEMRLFQQLVGTDADSVQLLRAALGKATRRVVVKRPAWAGALGDIETSISVSSPNTRYDIYVINGK